MVSLDGFLGSEVSLGLAKTHWELEVTFALLTLSNLFFQLTYWA